MPTPLPNARSIMAVPPTPHSDFAGSATYLSQIDIHWAAHVARIRISLGSLPGAPSRDSRLRPSETESRLARSPVGRPCQSVGRWWVAKRPSAPIRFASIYQ
jgi:hypothetical protein